MTAEVVADDGGGGGGVERFGGAVARDGNPARDARGDSGGEATTFAADHDHSVAQRRERVHIVAGEIAAEDGRAGSEGSEGGGEIGGVRADAGEGAHAGVDDFLGKEIGASRREDDAVEGEPVGEAEERADVASVLHAVEGKGEAAVDGTGREGRAGDGANGEDGGRRGEMAGAGHLFEGQASDFNF